MCDAILLFQLRRWNFEVALEFELAVNDVIDGIGAPIEWVEGATARPSATAPFVSEQHLGAVIVECGGMPVGKTRISDYVDARGFHGVSNIKQYAVTGAGAGGNVQ